MEIKRRHVWKSYDWHGNDGLQNLNYCPACGTKCEQAFQGGRDRPVCPACGFVYYKNPYPGVVVIIQDRDKILLGKRAEGSFQSGKWCLPGGFIEYDEDFLTSAIREVKEETNLEIEIQSILNVSSIFHSPELHTLVVTLVARVVEGVPRPGDDLDELRWFSYNDRLPEMAFPADEYVLENYDGLKRISLPVNTSITSEQGVEQKIT